MAGSGEPCFGHTILPVQHATPFPELPLKQQHYPSAARTEEACSCRYAPQKCIGHPSFLLESYAYSQGFDSLYHFSVLCRFYWEMKSQFAVTTSPLMTPFYGFSSLINLLATASNHCRHFRSVIQLLTQ